MSKGSKNRTKDREKYRKGWTKAFSKKGETCDKRK